MWWPKRDFEVHPPSCLEQKLTSWKHDTEGMSFWGAVVGHRASSTRTELAAGIVAAAASLSMHQATDSMAYKLKVNALLEGEDLTSRKPWSLQKDGDLWAVLERILLQKGFNSARVEWTKGHATQKDIDEGKSSPIKKIGNDKADKLADDGVDAHMNGLLQLATYYSKK